MKRMNNAFALFELLIVIAITAILTLCSVVSYQYFVDHQQLKKIAFTIMSALRYAQSEAINLGDRVDFCPKGDNPESCGSDWQQGQQVIVHKTHQLLRELSSIPSSYSIIWRGTLGENQMIQWEPNGFTYGQQGSFWISDRYARASQIEIILLRTGRVRVK